MTYNEFQKVVDKGRDRGAGTLVTEAAGLLGGDTEENRSHCLGRCSRQPGCLRRGPAPCVRPFGVHCTISYWSVLIGLAWNY
ncbi:hypothetical protein Y032_0195g1478 [Ancylostoma ceylanicum]|uniref:Uncharacterized protein n=1 Tax=Ancylostoma ceylanicum TaxID=53326 RepID=A0A016SPR4_9BILA|nr:hypothetical protein Y032_0195g1478 [Ancylostoma ceylanicum]